MITIDSEDYCNNLVLVFILQEVIKLLHGSGKGGGGGGMPPCSAMAMPLVMPVNELVALLTVIAFNRTVLYNSTVPYNYKLSHGLWYCSHTHTLTHTPNS